MVTQATVAVTRPSGGGAEQRATIANPLFAYRYTSSILRSQDAAALARAATTLRWPSGGVSSNARASGAMAADYRSRRTNTYQLFMIPSFNAFATDVFRSGSSPASWTSVESIHGEVHVSVGGQGGNMLSVPYSAFDPIFWLHHVSPGPQP